MSLLPDKTKIVVISVRKKKKGHYEGICVWRRTVVHTYGWYEGRRSLTGNHIVTGYIAIVAYVMYGFRVHRSWTRSARWAPYKLQPRLRCSYREAISQHLESRLREMICTGEGMLPNKHVLVQCKKITRYGNGLCKYKNWKRFLKISKMHTEKTKNKNVFAGSPSVSICKIESGRLKTRPSEIWLLCCTLVNIHIGFFVFSQHTSAPGFKSHVTEANKNHPCFRP